MVERMNVRSIGKTHYFNKKSKYGDTGTELSHGKSSNYNRNYKNSVKMVGKERVSDIYLSQFPEIDEYPRKQKVNKTKRKVTHRVKR